MCMLTLFGTVTQIRYISALEIVNTDTHTHTYIYNLHISTKQENIHYMGKIYQQTQMDK